MDTIEKDLGLECIYTNLKSYCGKEDYKYNFKDNSLEKKTDNISIFIYPNLNADEYDFYLAMKIKKEPISREKDFSYFKAVTHYLKTRYNFKIQSNDRYFEDDYFYVTKFENRGFFPKKDIDSLVTKIENSLIHSECETFKSHF